MGWDVSIFCRITAPPNIWTGSGQAKWGNVPIPNAAKAATKYPTFAMAARCQPSSSQRSAFKHVPDFVPRLFHS